jgi:endonuclease/exonuclease/phosphatase family metal-dependent hydrolase
LKNKPSANILTVAGGNLLRLINLGLVVATLLTYLCPLVHPSKTWIFMVFGLAYPFLLLGNILFLGFWLFNRKYYFLFSLVTILIGYGHFRNYVGWHFQNSKTQSADELVIMSYNMGGLTELSAKLDVAQKQQKLQTLAKAHKPDILCAQEISNQEQLNAIKKIFGFKYHFKEDATVLFSKFPFLRQQAFNFKKAENGCLWAELSTPAGDIRFYNLHLQSNKLTRTATRITTEGDIREKETWKDIRFVLSRYKQGVLVRSEQVEEVKTHMTDSRLPVIVCGDLNDTPISYVYNQIASDLKDSFTEKGFGLGATFAGRLPSLRIDYVLTSHEFSIASHKVLDVELSDHFPVLVRVRNKE